MPEITPIQPESGRPRITRPRLVPTVSSTPTSTATSISAAAAADTPAVTPPAPFGGAVLLPTKRAFEILHVSKTKGFALINAEVLKTVRIGRARMVTVESLLHVVRHGVDTEQLAEKVPSYLHRGKTRKPRKASKTRVAADTGGKAEPEGEPPLQ